MKLQQLSESMKSELHEQSTLRSELSKKGTLVEMLRKEIEVNIYNYYSNTPIAMYVCMYNALTLENSCYKILFITFNL